MFPSNTLSEQITAYIESQLEAVADYTVYKTPSIDFETPCINVAGGAPVLVSDVEAIRQWVTLFVTTPRDVYDIYYGTEFGTTLRRLYGRKIVNNGYAESELTRQIKEGLPLCPAIKQVTDVTIGKDGKYLTVDIQVKLYDGSLVDVSIEKVYTFS